MILVSVEAAIEPRRLREMGFAGHLSKPVRQSQLFDAIMEAISASEQDPSPAMPPQAAAPTASPQGLARSGAGRVLLAEDNEINQIVAREILIRSGYECDVVGDGETAVRAVQNVPYDLVLMDCQMPLMDGFMATKEIRRLEGLGMVRRHAGRRLPILALTANAMQGDRDRCLTAGMDGYASKPINPAELLAAMESVMKGDDPARAAA
jgi:CheY-like chemotaxis protein